MIAAPSPEQLGVIAGNIEALLLRRSLADVRPTPSEVIYRGPQRTVRRYTRPAGAPRRRGYPVLLVPPLAAPAICYDLRRECSLVEYLAATGRPTYLVDYGAISFADRDLGIEHWVDAVIPDALRAVSRDAGGKPVHLVGWSLGGVMVALVAADGPRRPIASVTMVGTPFDITQVPLVAPFRPLLNLGGGLGLTIAYRLLGGAPAALVQRGYELAAFDKLITKPLAVARNIGDRDFLAQIEAVDRFMGSMLAYPGRTFGQVFHRMIRGNELVHGEFEVGGRTVRVATMRAPALSIAGRDDQIAPRAAVHHVANLVPGIELATAPGGHLGVLTGRRARQTTWPTIVDFMVRHDRARPRHGRAGSARSGPGRR
jgi:polyhydroxyalkanoate synthase